MAVLLATAMTGASQLVFGTLCIILKWDFSFGIIRVGVLVSDLII